MLCISKISTGGGEPQQASVLTAIAVAEKNSATIHVQSDEIRILKFIRIQSGSTEVVEFSEQPWLDFDGKVEYIYSEPKDEN